MGNANRQSAEIEDIEHVELRGRYTAANDCGRRKTRIISFLRRRFFGKSRRLKASPPELSPKSWRPPIASVTAGGRRQLGAAAFHWKLPAIRPYTPANYLRLGILSAAKEARAESTSVSAETATGLTHPSECVDRDRRFDFWNKRRKSAEEQKKPRETFASRGFLCINPATPTLALVALPSA